MKNLILLSVLLFLFSCADGIVLQDKEIEPWLRNNHEALTEIVEIFQSNECLTRVEASWSEFKDQNCENEKIESDVESVLLILRKLNLVLAQSGSPPGSAGEAPKV